MEKTNNTKEAFELLALIAAEFISDPMSVQYFDIRVVKRVIACVERHNQERQKA